MIATRPLSSGDSSGGCMASARLESGRAFKVKAS